MEVADIPLVRKIIEVGNSKAVTIPKDWLEYYEKEYGRPIEEVAIEVDEVLKIYPLILKQNDNKEDSIKTQ
jgi:antitoxin component of MazEF toxin-antitoxin module